MDDEIEAVEHRPTYEMAPFKRERMNDEFLGREDER